jgi:hypothetical protein
LIIGFAAQSDIVDVRQCRPSAGGLNILHTPDSCRTLREKQTVPHPAITRHELLSASASIGSTLVVGSAASDCDRRRAYQALHTVLHCLRDRLTIGETAQLGDQLPMLDVYYEAWHPAGKPEKIRDS